MAIPAGTEDDVKIDPAASRPQQGDCANDGTGVTGQAGYSIDDPLNEWKYVVTDHVGRC